MSSSENSSSDNFGDETSNEYIHNLSKITMELRPKKKVKVSRYTKISKPLEEYLVIRVIDGEERLCFKYYTNKNYDERSNNEDEKHEFALRFDLESVDITKLDDKFKEENCIYLRANCEKEKYDGNRWNYETHINQIGWQLVSLNPELLYGKRGLIQQAVDSYRWFFRENSIKMRKDEIVDGVVRIKYISITPTFVPICWVNNGSTTKFKARVDIKNVDYGNIDDDFKAKYSIYTNKFDGTSSKMKKHCNKLAVKIAHLNKENIAFWNAVNTTDFATMIQKVVEECQNICHKYRNRYESEEIYESDELYTYNHDI